MIILGIDPGINTTGYGIISVVNKQVECLGFGGVKVPPNLSFSERLHKIFVDIGEVIRQFQPEVCAVENIFYHQNKRTAIVMGHARAAAMLAAAQVNVPVVEYTPREVKMSIVGNGAAAKEQVKWMVQKIMKLSESPVPEDAADALAVALCHYHRIRFNALIGS
ncbi:MAG: crossover junction endodeoxyribonuclease RuvC [Calditrichia bacterium]